MHAAKSQLSRLVEAVESGAEREIVLARGGKPVARLVPLEIAPQGQRLGLLKGRYSAPSFEAFTQDDAEIAALFTGSKP